jgi:hypothetical protein
LREEVSTTHAIDVFVTALEGQNFSPKTVRAYRDDLVQFAQWISSIRVDWDKPKRLGKTSARGSTPCVMEIVSWLTVGAIDTTWPGVSPCIADYIQAAQDAMDDEARQKLLVLVPALMHCAGADDPPDIESARRLFLAERSVSLLVPLVLEAAGWPHEADAVRASRDSFARLRAALREAAEYRLSNPLVAAVTECAQKLIACADDGQAAGQAQLPFRAAQLAVSVIQCNDAPARRLLLGERPRMRLLEFLEEAIITIIEEVIGPVRQPPPFADPWEVLEAGERFKAAMAEGFPPATPGQLETRRFAR